MKYYEDSATKEVFGYSDNQQSLIDTAIANGWTDVTDSWPPKPNNEELIIACVYNATQLLAQTDWSTLPDVSSTLNTHHLLNTQEFIDFRNQCRTYVINPIIDPVFPIIPTAQWS